MANEEYWNISLKADVSLFLIGQEKSSRFLHNIDRRRYLVWFKWLIFIAFSGQLMVSLPPCLTHLRFAFKWKKWIWTELGNCPLSLKVKMCDRLTQPLQRASTIWESEAILWKQHLVWEVESRGWEGAKMNNARLSLNSPPMLSSPDRPG